MSGTKKSLIVKLFSGIVLILMVITLIQTLIITPTPVVAVSVGFGEKFYNGDHTKYICVCEDILL